MIVAQRHDSFALDFRFSIDLFMLHCSFAHDHQINLDRQID
jgi:hypothetical protein